MEIAKDVFKDAQVVTVPQLAKFVWENMLSNLILVANFVKRKLLDAKCAVIIQQFNVLIALLDILFKELFVNYAHQPLKDAQYALVHPFAKHVHRDIIIL